MQIDMSFVLRITFIALTLRFTNVKGQESLCQLEMQGSCLNPAAQCCGGEIVERDDLCALAGSGMKCCLPEAACGRAFHNVGGTCIQAGVTECDPIYMGWCPADKICCGPLSGEPDLVRATTPPITGPPGPPRPPGPPGPPGPPRPPRPTGPPSTTNSTERPPNVVYCSIAAQKDACDVLADNAIIALDGPALVAHIMTSVPDDNSSPYNNLLDTCYGYPIQTTTSVHLCNGYVVCLHENVPRYLRCLRRLCGGYTVLNIGSDSYAPDWIAHCLGNAVDVYMPDGCRGREEDVKELCNALDGTGTLYRSGRPGFRDVYHCDFPRPT